VTSLRLRLLAVVAATVSPFVFYAFTNAQRERAAAGEMLAEQSLQRARAAAGQLDAQLTVVDRLLDSALVIARQPMRLSSPNALPGDSSRAGVNQFTPTIGALGIAGAVVGTVTGDRSLLDQLPVTRRAKLASAAAGPFADDGEAPASTLVDDGEGRSTSDSVAMIVARTVPRSGGACQCLADSAVVLVALLTDIDVERLIGGDTLSNGAVATVIGGRGTQVGRLPARERWIADTSAGELLRPTAVERQGTFEMRGVDGVARSVGFAAIGKLPWRVYIGVPAAAAFTAVEHRLNDLLLLSALALAIAVIGVELAVRSTETRTVVSPVRDAVPGHSAGDVLPAVSSASQAPPAVIMSEEELLEFGDDIDRLVQLSHPPATPHLEAAGSDRR